MRGTVLVLASTMLACAPAPDLAQGEVVEACRRLVVCGGGMDGTHLYGRGDLFGGSARTCEAYYEVGPVRLGDPAGELACALEAVDCDGIRACRGVARAPAPEGGEGARCEGARLVERAAGVEQSFDCARLGWTCVEGDAPRCRPPRRRGGRAHVRVGEDRAPRVSIDATYLADPTLLRGLANGRTHTLVTHVFAEEAAGDAPIEVARRTCRVRHDAWLRAYLVTIVVVKDAKPIAVAQLDGVLEECLHLEEVEVSGAARELVSSRALRFAGVVEVNPPSAATLERIRRWLRRSDGAEGERGFFGSFVGDLVGGRVERPERSLGEPP